MDRFAESTAAQATGTPHGRYRAKVGHAGRVNANRRVYPAAEWARNIDLWNRERCPAGRAVGAVDHEGSCEGGNLKHTPILWHRLEMDSSGAVYGEFTIVERHTDGANLKAQIDAGMGIGFSTYGYGNSRPPTAAERATFGIPADDEHAVIMEDWELVKIDVVDNPSVRDAWLARERVSESMEDVDAAPVEDRMCRALRRMHDQLANDDEPADELESGAAELADAVRRSKVAEALDVALAGADMRAERQIRRLAEQRLDDDSFGPAAAAAFVVAKMREYEDLVSA